jgi:CRISPR-associated protein Csx17
VSTVTEHRLGGCTPVPLAYYLKALGVLRLVTEQADPAARGFWARDDVFVLQTRLARAELEEFFRERYAPTPIVGPWGARSGFYPGSSETSSREALEAILASTRTAGQPDRLARFRDTIRTVQRLLDKLGIEEKSKDRKAELMQACRARLPDDVVGWLDACYVLTDGAPRFPPILGTGGNEGSGSYSGNFAGYVVSCVLERSHDAIVAQALWDPATARVPDVTMSGQFLPGAATGNLKMTPWDYLLCIEGSLLFAAALVRRSEDQPGALGAPFTVRSVSAGYGSAAPEKTRAEMWFPLWHRPLRLSELMHVLREGRAELSGLPARNGSDFARAVASLGVDRGITAFQRYGIHERNGQANFAIPLERLAVQHRPKVALLLEIDGWLDRFRRQVTAKGAPAAAGRALRNLDESILALCRQDDALRLRAVLVALGRCERTMARSRRWATESRLAPVPPLSRDWLAGCDDQTPELRLAAALASVHGSYGQRSLWLRQHLEPVSIRILRQPRKLRVEWAESESRDVVWADGDLIGSLSHVLERRLLPAEETAERTRLDRAGLAVDLGDVADFIEGRVDDHLLDDLVWACALLDWAAIETRKSPLTPRTPAGEPWPGAFYSLLALCFASSEVRGMKIPVVPIVHRLAASGRSAEASRQAARRLRASGLAPLVSLVGMPGLLAQRAAAALVFPLGPENVERLARRVLQREEADTTATSSDDTSEQGAVA